MPRLSVALCVLMQHVSSSYAVECPASNECAGIPDILHCLSILDCLTVLRCLDAMSIAAFTTAARKGSATTTLVLEHAQSTSYPTQDIRLGKPGFNFRLVLPCWLVEPSYMHSEYLNELLITAQCDTVRGTKPTWLRSVAASFQVLVAKWMLWLSCTLDRW